MKTNTPLCPKCNNDMTPGGIVPRINKSLLRMAWGFVNKWVEGVVEGDKAGFIDMKDKDTYPIETYRCINCGYLESYAKANE